MVFGCITRLSVLVALLTLIACERPAPGEFATMVISNTRVWTGDPNRPWAEAVAIKDDKILAVGSAADIGKLRNPQSTQVIDAPGRLLVPGFIDTHVHFIDGGAALASVQLRDATSPQEFTRRIAAFAKTVEPGEWILGGTWDHQNWGGELPRRDWIDAVTPDNPVWVHRLDGHMALANSLALKAGGVEYTRYCRRRNSSL